MKKSKNLIKIGRVNVKSAIGFFWLENSIIYLISSQEDIDEFSSREIGATIHPMNELEKAFIESNAFRFISWCKGGSVVKQGARQVTFEYSDHKSTIHIK